MSDPATITDFTIAPGVRETASEDGAVLLDVEQGVCFSLNPVGLRIWELLKIEMFPRSDCGCHGTGIPCIPISASLRRNRIPCRTGSQAFDSSTGSTRAQEILVLQNVTAPEGAIISPLARGCARVFQPGLWMMRGGHTRRDEE